MKKSSVLNKKSMSFLENYLNNPSPTGYEWEGQKIWMNYLKPYVDSFITDTYGTAVGVINPDAPLRLSSKHILMRFHGTSTILLKMDSFM
jgi:endoglucanase